MDKAVQDQDFLKAAGLKNSIAKAKLVQFIHVLLCWFVGWFIDKKGFTNKPKLLILFVVMKKMCPEFLVTLKKNKSAENNH